MAVGSSRQWRPSRESSSSKGHTSVDARSGQSSQGSGSSSSQSNRSPSSFVDINPHDLAQLGGKAARFSSVLKSSNNDDSSSLHDSEFSFVPYLPHDDAVAAGLGAHQGGIDAVEAQEVADILNEELGKLLKMRFSEFWRTVTMDSSIQVSLDSYLQFRRRWYDAAANEDRKSLAGMIVGDQELCRRVFMVLFRMSSHFEPGFAAIDCLSPEQHAEILQDKKLFDIPKLLDICAIFYHDNPDLTGCLVSNVFAAQKQLNADLAEVVPILLKTLHTMHERCFSTLLLEKQMANSQGSVATKLQLELFEILDYLNDVVISLHSFIGAYPQGAVILVSIGTQSDWKDQLLPTLAAVHDALLPTIHKSLSLLGPATATNHTEAAADLRMKKLRVRLVELAWTSLSLSYLNEGSPVGHYEGTADALDRTLMTDPGARGEAFVQLLSNMAADPSEGFDQLPVGAKEELISTGALLRNIERKHKLLNMVDQLCQKGLITLDGAQYEFITALVNYTSSVSSELPYSSNFSVVNQQGGQKQEADIMYESKISHIKDILPDYGNGFIAACLEAYDYNPEEVIQRILEGTLHPSLLSLDKLLESKPDGLAATVLAKDKGKGKLDKGKGMVDEVTPLDFNMNGSLNGTVREIMKDATLSDSTVSNFEADRLAHRLASSMSASSSSAGQLGRISPSKVLVSDSVNSLKGRFVRKDKGEGNVAQLLDERDAEDALRTAAYAAQYEDEYDDSFDDLGTHIADGVEETESLLDLMASKSSIGPSADPEWTNSVSTRIKSDGLPKGIWNGVDRGVSRGSVAMPMNSNSQRTSFERETGNRSSDTNKRLPSHPIRGTGRSRREEPRAQYFVKDGKNYSYKVAGSVAVSSAEEAEALKVSQEEMIHGLGRGGNVPIKPQETSDRKTTPGADVQGPTRSDFSGRTGTHNRGRGGPRREHDNHHRKDRATKKHFASVGGV